VDEGGPAPPARLSKGQKKNLRKKKQRMALQEAEAKLLEHQRAAASLPADQLRLAAQLAAAAAAGTGDAGSYGSQHLAAASAVAALNTHSSPAGVQALSFDHLLASVNAIQASLQHQQQQQHLHGLAAHGMVAASGATLGVQAAGGAHAGPCAACGATAVPVCCTAHWHPQGLVAAPQTDAATHDVAALPALHYQQQQYMHMQYAPPPAHLVATTPYGGGPALATLGYEVPTLGYSPQGGVAFPGLVACQAANHPHACAAAYGAPYHLLHHHHNHQYNHQAAVAPASQAASGHAVPGVARSSGQAPAAGVAAGVGVCQQGHALAQGNQPLSNRHAFPAATLHSPHSAAALQAAAPPHLPDAAAHHQCQGEPRAGPSTAASVQSAPPGDARAAQAHLGQSAHTATAALARAMGTPAQESPLALARGAGPCKATVQAHSAYAILAIKSAECGAGPSPPASSRACISEVALVVLDTSSLSLLDHFRASVRPPPGLLGPPPAVAVDAEELAVVLVKVRQWLTSLGLCEGCPRAAFGVVACSGPRVASQLAHACAASSLAVPQWAEDLIFLPHTFSRFYNASAPGATGASTQPSMAHMASALGLEPPGPSALEEAAVGLQIMVRMLYGGACFASNDHAQTSRAALSAVGAAPEASQMPPPASVSLLPPGPALEDRTRSASASSTARCARGRSGALAMPSAPGIITLPLRPASSSGGTPVVGPGGLAAGAGQGAGAPFASATSQVVSPVPPAQRAIAPRHSLPGAGTRVADAAAPLLQALSELQLVGGVSTSGGGQHGGGAQPEGSQDDHLFPEELILPVIQHVLPEDDATLEELLDTAKASHGDARMAALAQAQAHVEAHAWGMPLPQAGSAALPSCSS